MYVFRVFGVGLLFSKLVFVEFVLSFIEEGIEGFSVFSFMVFD